jgi:predicted acetyltransferase
VQDVKVSESINLRLDAHVIHACVMLTRESLAELLDLMVDHRTSFIVVVTSLHSNDTITCVSTMPRLSSYPDSNQDTTAPTYTRFLSMPTDLPS